MSASPVWLGCVCLLASGSAAAQCSEASQTERVAPKHFPKHMGSLSSDGKPQGFARAGCGVSVKYTRAEGELVCTLYVYDGGRTDIGTGLTPAVEQEFVRVLDAVSDKSEPWVAPHSLKQDGHTNDAKAATFTLRHGELASMALLTGFRGQFLKLRCTGLAGSDDARAAMWGFVRAVGDRLNEFVDAPKEPAEPQTSLGVRGTGLR